MIAVILQPSVSRSSLEGDHHPEEEGSRRIRASFNDDEFAGTYCLAEHSLIFSVPA